MPTLLTCLRVMLTHAPLHTASVTTSFISGVKSICGAYRIGAILWSILGFIVGPTTGGSGYSITFVQNYHF